MIRQIYTKIRQNKFYIYISHRQNCFKADSLSELYQICSSQIMQEIRYIENPFAKILNIVNPDQTQIYSLLIKLLQKFFKDIKIPTLICNASEPSKNSLDTSAYTGTAGYLYMFIRLYHFFDNQSEGESDIFQSKSHIVGDEIMYKLKDPLFYIKVAEEQYEMLRDHIMKGKKESQCFSFFISEVSVWLCGMHIAYIKRNLPLFRDNEDMIYRCFKTLKAGLKKTQWELLYGVPGFLYAILELQKAYGSAEELFKTYFSPIAMQLTEMIIDKGVSNYEQLKKTKINIDKLPEDFRLVYFFYKSQYLGGAHGLGGNLNIILTSIKYNNFGPKINHFLPLIKSSVTFLLKHLINGNFSTSAGSTKIKLVHFCHGAPGIVTALAKFSEIFPEMAIQMGIREVIQVNLQHIWKYGVLKKGFGLCHGISGNAYTFISPSLQEVFPQRTKEFLKKAQLMALLHQQQGVMKEIREFAFKDRYTVGTSDEPYSLMLGVAGDICFTMDVLKGTGYFPGYDL